MLAIRTISASAFALALLAAGSVMAAPTGLFGNTLKITAPNGQVKLYYVNSDGTYTGMMPGGVNVSGTWAETVDGMCFTQQQPSPVAAQCGPLITHAAGDVWTAQRSDGTTTQLTVAVGR